MEKEHLLGADGIGFPYGDLPVGKLRWQHLGQRPAGDGAIPIVAVAFVVNTAEGPWGVILGVLTYIHKAVQ